MDIPGIARLLAVLKNHGVVFFSDGSMSVQFMPGASTSQTNPKVTAMQDPETFGGRVPSITRRDDNVDNE